MLFYFYIREENQYQTDFLCIHIENWGEFRIKYWMWLFFSTIMYYAERNNPDEDMRKYYTRHILFFPALKISLSSLHLGNPKYKSFSRLNLPAIYLLTTIWRCTALSQNRNNWLKIVPFWRYVPTAGKKSAASIYRFPVCRHDG